MGEQAEGVDVAHSGTDALADDDNEFEEDSLGAALAELFEEFNAREDGPIGDFEGMLGEGVESEDDLFGEEPLTERLGIAPPHGGDDGGADVAASSDGLAASRADDERATDCDLVAAVVAVEEVVVADEPPAGAGHAPAAARGDISISDIGYVKTTKPGFDPDQVIGYVNYRGDGSNIFANCHLHPKCSVSAGIRRHDVTREYMAEWLTMGEPVSLDLPRDVRLAAGVRHRELWVRPY